MRTLTLKRLMELDAVAQDDGEPYRLSIESLSATAYGEAYYGKADAIDRCPRAVRRAFEAGRTDRPTV